MSFATTYLDRFGYPDVRSFQVEAGLEVDNDAGPQTLRVMGTAPRCAVSDAEGLGMSTEGRPDRDWVAEPLLYLFRSFVRS